MQPGMAGFLPQNLQAFTPESIDLAHLRQRQALADALLQSSATPISTQRQSGRFVSAISPLEGLTKLAEAYIGSKQHKAIEQDSRDMAGNRAKRFVEALRGKSSIAPEERPSESLGAPYNADAYDTKTPNRYNVPGATAPQWMDPTRPSSGLQANSVEVRGKVPQEQPQAPDPIAQMRAQVADYVEQGVMSPDQGMQLLSGLQQKMLEQQMQRPTYTYQTTGDGQIVGLPNTGGAAIQTGVRGEQKAPTFVDSGAGTDSSGRPLAVQKRWDPIQGKAVPIEGVDPVTKGPLATATANATASNKANEKGFEKVADKQAEQVAATAGRARTAQQGIMNTVDPMLRVLDSGKFVMGPTADQRVWMRQLGDTMGITGKSNEEILANTRTLIQGMAGQELDSAARLAGQGQISNAEREIIAQAASGKLATMTPPELRQLLLATRKVHLLTIGQHRSNVDVLKKTPGAPTILPEWDINSPGEYVPERRANDKPKGKPAAPKIQPGTVADGYRFKGGNPNDPNAWEPVK